MRSSSLRATPSLKNVSGWFGIIRSSLTMVLVRAAKVASMTSVFGSSVRSLPPPAMKSSDVSLSTVSGRITVRWCFHSGRSTSAAVRHVCDVISSVVTVSLPS